MAGKLHAGGTTRGFGHPAYFAFTVKRIVYHITVGQGKRAGFVDAAEFSSGLQLKEKLFTT